MRTLVRSLVIKLAAICQLLKKYREDDCLVFCDVNTKKEVQVCSNHFHLLGSQLMEIPVEVSVLIWIKFLGVGTV
jgi:hypothetical protein